MNNLPATQQRQLVFTDKEMSVLKATLFEKFDDHEINYALSVCKFLNLNPLLRQIHFVKRKDKSTGKYKVVTQTGIDGLRLTAERTGQYAGSDEPLYEYDGDNKKAPTKATVTVYKMIQGQRCAFTASARWIEYCPSAGQDHMWKRMPHNQLAKCAEALALRKAFPTELSSVYEDSEMQQAEGSDKASRIQEQATGEKKESKKSEPIDAEFSDQTEPPEEPSEPEVPPCPLCGKDRLLSSSGKAYYCPNWNDKKGEHPRFYP